MNQEVKVKIDQIIVDFSTKLTIVGLINVVGLNNYFLFWIDCL